LAVEGVRRIADRYRESFTNGLEDVRESIEDSMIKFGTTLSEDALNQITQRSAALSEAVAKITSEQHKKITHETDDIKSQLTHYDDKYTELNESVTKYTKTVDRLNSSSIHCVRVIANNNNRISAIQEKQDDMYSKFNKDLDALKERLAGFTPMLKKMQSDLTATFKKDMSTLSATLTDFQTRQNDDRKTLEQLKSANASIKQQVADLFSTDPKHSSKNTNWNNLKSQIDKHEILVTDLQRRVDLVVRNDETLDEQDKWKSYSPTARLDKMENLVTQLSTKFNSIKQQLDLNKGASPPPQSGAKRSRDSALGSDDNDDKRKALEESIKLLDKKISSLSEFVYQFHSTILDPSFPHKLESTIHHLEDCLK
jgi:chromosome segregation ATPase